MIQIKTNLVGIDLVKFTQNFQKQIQSTSTN